MERNSAQERQNTRDDVKTQRTEDVIKAHQMLVNSDTTATISALENYLRSYFTVYEEETLKVASE